MERVLGIKKRLDEIVGDGKQDVEERVSLLKALEDVKMDLSILEKTKIGIPINKLRKSSDQTISRLAKQLVKTWKTIAKDASASPKVCIKALEIPANFDEAKHNVSDDTRNLARSKLSDSFSLVSTAHRLYLSISIEEALFARFKDTGKEYKAQLRMLLFNLKTLKNADFNGRVCSGEFTFEQLSKMDSRDMASAEQIERMKKIRKNAQESSRSDWDKEHRVGGTTEMWRCGKCGERKCTYYQMQTRGADEPMTNFVTCTICDNRWRC